MVLVLILVLVLVGVACIGVTCVGIVVVCVASVGIVVVVVVVCVASNSESDTVILRTTLSNRHDDRLVVGSTGHGADTVVSSRQTTGNVSSEQTISVTSIVDTLEESELSTVKRRGRIQAVAGVLDDNVSVANDVSRAIKVLRSRVVGAVGVGEGASSQVGNLDLDTEVLVGGDVVTVLGVNKDGGNRLGLGRNLSHRDTVAGTSLLLETVGQSLTGTEVDEVGGVTTVNG